MKDSCFVIFTELSIVVVALVAVVAAASFTAIEERNRRRESVITTNKTTDNVKTRYTLFLVSLLDGNTSALFVLLNGDADIEPDFSTWSNKIIILNILCLIH
jgi:hypothetical protein